MVFFAPHMAESGESRREFVLLDAFDPTTKETCKVQISYERMQAVARRGMIQASECAHIVPEILQAPKAVFEGLRYDEDEDRFGDAAGWRCYCGIPKNSYRANGEPAKPYEDKVYLVFINDQGVAYNWRWEKCDPDDPRLPMDHETRFKRRLK